MHELRGLPPMAGPACLRRQELRLSFSTYCQHLLSLLFPPLQLPEPGDGFRIVGQLLEGLLSTNPRALDAKAAIGLKVSEKSLLLDNPAAKAGKLLPLLTSL